MNADTLPKSDLDLHKRVAEGLTFDRRIASVGAIMGCRAAARAGRRRWILSVMRTLGTSIGVACASALLSWRIAASIDPSSNRSEVYLSAVHDAVIVFIMFALLAAAISFLRRTEQFARRDVAPVRGIKSMDGATIRDPGLRRTKRRPRRPEE